MVVIKMRGNDQYETKMAYRPLLTVKQSKNSHLFCAFGDKDVVLHPLPSFHDPNDRCFDFVFPVLVNLDREAKTTGEAKVVSMLLPRRKFTVKECACTANGTQEPTLALSDLFQTILNKP